MSAYQQGNYRSFGVVNLDRQQGVKIIRQRGVNLVRQEVVFYASFSNLETITDKLRQCKDEKTPICLHRGANRRQMRQTSKNVKV